MHPNPHDLRLHETASGGLVYNDDVFKVTHDPVVVPDE
jgi:hypothetical protein